MKNEGQSLVEFAIILALVVVVGIAAYSLLGDNVNTMFRSSKTKYEAFKPYGEAPVETAGSPANDEAIPVGNESPLSGSSKTIGDVEVTFNNDNSASLTVGSQNVTLSSEILNNLDTVFETSGSSGLNTHIVEAIEKLITAHSDDYEGDVPIEISFGSGVREGDMGYYEGKAEFNTATVTVGDHVVIVQNDQYCDDWGEPDKCLNMGIHTIDIPDISAKDSEATISSTAAGLDGKTTWIHSVSENEITTGNDGYSWDFNLN